MRYGITFENLSTVGQQHSLDTILITVGTVLITVICTGGGGAGAAEAELDPCSDRATAIHDEHEVR